MHKARNVQISIVFTIMLDSAPRSSISTVMLNAQGLRLVLESVHSWQRASDDHDGSDHGPSRLDRANKVFLSLLGANVGVYVAWKASTAWGTAQGTAAAMNFMLRNFTVSPDTIRTRRIFPYLGSFYSHIGGIHLSLNMLGTWSFLRGILNRPDSRTGRPMGVTEALTLYHVSGLVSSVASAVWMRVMRLNMRSVGASGALFGLLTYYSLVHPQDRIAFLFVISMDAPSALALLTVVNVGLVLLNFTRRRVLVDGMGHLGGTAVGALWYLARRRQLQINEDSFQER